MRNIPSRDRYVPRYGITSHFEDTYGCWTCCICGCAVRPDEEYTFCGNDVCHEKCKIEKENEDGK